MLQLSPSALKQAGYNFGQYQVNIPVGTPFSALLVPEYWINVAGRLRRYDEIRAVADDDTFDVLLTVARVEHAVGSVPYAKMRVLRYWEPSHDEDTSEARDEALAETAGGFTVSFAPKHRWRVVDPGGNVVMKGLETEAAAQDWLAGHLDQRAA